MKNLKKSLAVILTLIMLISTHAFICPILAEELAEPPMNEELLEKEAPEAEILSEVIEKRDEYTKHFYMSDGTFLATEYAIPVHFEAETGDWVEYDNTLVQQENEESGVYTTTLSNHPTSLAVKAESGKTASIDDPEYPISWGYEDVKSSKLRINDKNVNKKGNEKFTTLEKITSTAEYKNIFPHVDLQYVINSEGAKENLILKNKNASSSYVIAYQIGSLAAKKIDDKTIELQDENGDAVYVITAPTMYDASAQYSDALTIDIISIKEGILHVQLSVDGNWLKDKAREFPVVVDPTITTKTTRSTIDSVFVASSNSYKNTNFSDRQEMLVGRESSAYQYCRSLFRFELPQLNKGDIVVNATLNVVNSELSFYASTTPDMQVNAHLITSSWNMNSVTWNTSPSYNSTILDYDMFRRSESLGWKQFDVSSAVKEWYETDENYGILLKSNDESSSAAINGVKAKIWTERYNSVQDYYPVIAITYRNNKGLEDYWTYTTLSAGTAGTAHINDYTGNLVFVHGDISTTGELMPISLDHVYNGYMANKYPDVYPASGRGNKLSLQQTVKTSSYYGLTGDALTNYPYAYEDGDGTVHFFYKKTENSITKYIDEDGLNLELKILSGSSGYTITDKSDNVLTFNSVGNLASIADAEGRTATLSYTNNQLPNGTTKPFLTSITDGAGHVINLVYNTGSNGYHLTGITGPDGKTITYATSGGRLSSITYPDGTQSTYTYDDEGCMLTACSADGYTLTFTYTTDGTKRVKTVTESNGSTTGQKIVFNRNKINQTIIETYGKDPTNSSDNIVTTYQFDNYGRTVSTKSRRKDGIMLGAEKYDYTQGQSSDTVEINKRNRVSASAAFGKTVDNLIKNSSAESSTDWTKLYWLRSITDTSIANASIVSNDAYLGQKSIRVRVSECDEIGGYSMYQNTTSLLAPGQTYTISTYVKASNIVPTIASTQGGACLAMRFTLSDNSFSRVYSNVITGTTSTDIENGWQRISKTFTVPTNAIASRAVLLVYNATGAANFDCVQIESGDATNTYNLLSDSGFEREDGSWSNATTMTSSDVISTAYYVEGGKSQKITGNSSTNKYIYQTVKTKGTEQDTYVLSGWAKANAVPLTDNDRKFELTVKITYDDDTTKTYHPVAFNPDVDAWQFSSGVFTLSDGDNNTNKTPVSIRVYCNYSHQANAAYFDNIRLTREPCPSYTYDDKGNLISATENAQKTSALSYDAKDNLSSLTDERGANYQYTYATTGNKHRLLSAVSATSGVQYNYSYYSNGNLKAQEISNANETAIIRTGINYSAASSGIAEGAYVYKENDENGYSTTYNYNVLTGRLESVVDPLNNTTSYTYNANNGLVTSVSSGNSSVQYTYNSSQTHLSSISHGGTQYNFTYDGFGNVTNTKVGTQTLVTNQYQSRNGSLTRSTYGNGDYTTYEYNDYGQTTAVRKNNSLKYDWSYNSSAYPYRVNDYENDLTHTYEYDSLGRLIGQYGSNRITGDLRFVGRYSYDTSNNVTKVANTADGYTMTVSHSYNAENVPTQLTMGAYAFNYTYNTLNQPKKTTLTTTTPVEISYSYVSSARNASDSSLYHTSQIKNETIAGTVYCYTYDRNGNITTISEGTSANNATLQQSYKYDSLGQLIRVDDKKLNKTIQYTYNAAGNITKKTEHAYTTATTPGTATSTVNYTYGDSNWKDKLTSYNGQTITYDAIGNPLTYRNGMSFTWQGRQMQTANLNGTTVTYKYNADGLRSYKSVGSTVSEYEYLGDQLVYEKRGDYRFYFAYDAMGNLAEIIRINPAGTVYTCFVLCNSRGDVLELRNTDGSLFAKYQYDAWGNTTHIYSAAGNEITSQYNVAVQNPIRYRGYYYDSESGLYYLQSRYYDPVTCRFISADGQLSYVGGDVLGYNLYAFCMNNPVNMTDSSGRWPNWIKKIASVVVNRVKSIVSKVTKLVSNIIKANSNSLPKTGEPGSSRTLHNPDGTPKQKRWYGPDGNAKRDRDYNHGGDVQFPHDHEWKNGKRGVDHLPPSPEYEFRVEPLIGLGIFTACAIGLAVVASDDVFGIGVIDDFLLAPLGAGFSKGLIMMFG